jgi:hypothetical protein
MIRFVRRRSRAMPRMMPCSEQPTTHLHAASDRLPAMHSRGVRNHGLMLFDIGAPLSWNVP